MSILVHNILIYTPMCEMFKFNHRAIHMDWVIINIEQLFGPINCLCCICTMMHQCDRCCLAGYYSKMDRIVLNFGDRHVGNRSCIQSVKINVLNVNFNHIMDWVIVNIEQLFGPVNCLCCMLYHACFAV